VTPFGRRRRKERGSVAVEFALCIPALCIIIFGGIYLARAVHARARLVDAVGVATRAAAIRAATTGTVDENALRQTINARMADVSGCANPITIEPRTVNDPLPRLEVKATCRVTGSAIPFLSTVSIASVTATAAMPLDLPPN
jgi:Flp pilus assembly protein TadG